MVVPAPLLHRARQLRGAGLCLALFALVTGARWAAIDRFGSDMPNWDQWDAEAVQVLIPWFEDDHFLSHLFQPHNEHRVVLTKLQNLALVLLGGQWDARLQCVANAVLSGLLAVGLWWTITRGCARRWHVPLLALTAVAFGLPLAWENILGGFHSQQYWLLGLSGLAITLLPFARPWTCAWWIGAAAGVLALGSMATGFFAAAIAAVVVGVRLLRGDTSVRDSWPTFGIAFLILATAAATRVEFPPHDPLKAGSVMEFLLHLVRSLQWPWREQAWVGALLWLPWLLLVVRSGTSSIYAAAGRPPADDRTVQTILALGGWVALQLLATAYARGAGAQYPAPRYLDTLALGLVVNGAALAWLLSPDATPSTDGQRRPGAVLIATAWWIVVALGLFATAQRHLREDLPRNRQELAAAEAHLRGYLATDNPAELAFDALPFPSAEGLISRLAHPSLRALMPVGVRAPLPFAAAAEASPRFHANLVAQRDLAGGPQHGLSPATPPLGAHATWGSFAANGTTGLWISKPLESPLGGWLKLETAGHLGETGTALELHDAQTGRALATLRPSRVPGDSWRAAYVRAPTRPFVIVARDSDSARWFAFSAPVEMSAWSYFGRQAAKHGLLFGLIGGALGLMPAVLVGLSSFNRPAGRVPPSR